MRVLLLSLLLFSCGEGIFSPLPLVVEPDLTVPPVVLTLEQRLSAADVPVLQISPSDSRGAISARPVQQQSWYAVIDLRATGGTMVVRLVPRANQTDLKLEQLEVRLADVPLFDTGLLLTGLHFHFDAAQQLPVTWLAERTVAEAQLTATLRVSGAFMGPSGVPSPFETQVVEGVPLAVRVGLDEGHHVVARFRTQGDQTPSWSWANLLETGAANFEGRAAEVGEPESSLY